MATFRMNVYRDLNCALKEQHQDVKPFVNTSLTKASAPSARIDAIKPFGSMTENPEYEVFCPNCARVEFARESDMSRHKCNCGYGVAVEMLRTSPN
jgi:hypothetical protein